VQHAAVVGCLHGIGHAGQDRCGLPRWQRAGGQLLGECRALDEPHAVERKAVDFTHLEDRHDPRVVEPCGCLRLAAKPRQIGGAREIATQEHLDRDGTAQAPLLGSVDHAHAAAADLLDKFVVAERRRQGGDAGHEPRQARRRDGGAEHHLVVGRSMTAIEHGRLLRDRVGDEHGRVEFAEVTCECGMRSCEFFQPLLSRAGRSLGQLFHERGKLLLQLG